MKTVITLVAVDEVIIRIEVEVGVPVIQVTIVIVGQGAEIVPGTIVTEVAIVTDLGIAATVVPREVVTYVVTKGDPHPVMKAQVTRRSQQPACLP